nr:hypothetical protein GTC16762_31150 [Pigmentibacter ruber]
MIMEDYLIKIYINPLPVIRKLNSKKIFYFYRYFKQELLFLSSFELFEQLNDKRFIKDMKKLKLILNIMKAEIKRRRNLLVYY